MAVIKDRKVIKDRSGKLINIHYSIDDNGVPFEVGIGDDNLNEAKLYLENNPSKNDVTQEMKDAHKLYVIDVFNLNKRTEIITEINEEI